MIGVVSLMCALGVVVCGVGLSSLKQVLSRELVRSVARVFALFDFTDLSYLYPRFAFCRF